MANFLQKIDKLILLIFFPDFFFCFLGEADERDQSKLEEKLWDPECPLTNKQIDQFLVVAR